MQNITINLPYHTFRLKLSKKPKAERGFVKLFGLDYIANVRSGNKISRVARHFLERTNVRAFLGGNITLAVLAAGVIVPAANFAQTEPELAVLPAINPHVTTEVNIRYPLDKFRLNQSFSYFHPGVDLGDPVGVVVFPIENGKVASTVYDRFGYGNSVVVEHNDGLTSRYAHLSRIDVRAGDSVNTKTEIGLVGNTGHSTGPHLHLEVRKNDVPLNPIAVLGPIPQN